MDFPVYSPSASGNSTPAPVQPPTAALADIEDDEDVPIFSIERVQLQFQISSLAAMAVSNNILYLAVASGRILRIDLNNPQDIEDTELPKLKAPGTGNVKDIFLDPTGSHLLVTTTTAENFYLNLRANRAKQLSRMKGNVITSVAWNPTEPSSSTKEILIGTADGKVIETYIEPSEEFFKREERFSKLVWRTPGGVAVDGLYVELLPGKPDMRRLIATTGGRLWHWVSKIVRHAPGDYSPTFTKFFDDEESAVHVDYSPSARSLLSISPEDESFTDDRTFAWLNESGIFYGKLYTAPTTADLGTIIFQDSKLYPESKLPSSSSPISCMTLTKYHALILRDNQILAVNLLDNTIVFDERLPYSDKFLGLTSDVKNSTYWAYSSDSIYEITVTNEDRDIWRIYLSQNRFDEAQRLAKTPRERDAVAVANGEFLLEQQSYLEAANVLGKSSKPFESVAIQLMENKKTDALRRYLIVKLGGYKSSQLMQRTMLASWIVEVFMEKLNSLEDSMATKESEKTTEPEEKEKPNGVNGETNALFDKPRKKRAADNGVSADIRKVKEEFQDFVTRHKNDLDVKTTYDIISSHGRQEELLFYANSVNDYSFVLSYWVRLEKWSEALTVLRKQDESDIYYKYSTVLLVNCPKETIDTWMRMPELQPRKLIPAILSYSLAVPTGDQNQAIRYLLYAINTLKSRDAAVHNTLISIYASDKSKDETPLLEYLQFHDIERCYDTDFALRLCIKHERVQSCIFIYSSMGLYEEAVDLALQHDNVELASVVADRPGDNASLRKKLWLRVAQKVINKEHGIKSAIEFLKRCELLKIEDLLPFFPDFVVIDDFKDEICAALEEYSRNIDQLRKEMDESAKTSETIRADINSLSTRFAIVEPGERCFICSYPLLSRQFYVFPCQHSFHGDCLINKVAEISNQRVRRKITHLQLEAQKSGGGISDELDELVAAECILCGPHMINSIDEHFVDEKDKELAAEWEL
ncbi:Pep3/Vps18/deep orange family-domain-containing protein [Lipomyces tetrasporus]|uniref:Pep3/Vps18/deep orange family-domain-containing protein n=1 Tax=Lipomyces tetrasporus TaxID=54092 RepID=A0AAD7QQL7_9ASCO|nr:Pep3/Vps18/deep orange family-domain-containing protein [Lipomyces tetrasporus]KAJ8099762.1 Pep3/Vps18/deep orange family-domain-containing protein [Lipomyces tetrasporus]